MTATRTTLLLCLIGLAAFLFINRSRTADDDFYSLKGGETIAIRSLASNKYLTLSPSSGRVTASADTASAAASQFKVLLLDIDTVSALLRSANSIDERSEAFTGRKMLTASGCQCSGYSNAFGLGRFCHPWEDAMQESWCYVSDNCSSATSRGSFGRRYESCEKPPDVPDDSDYMRQQSAAFEPDTGGSASTLVPASGCKCSGFSSKLGFGSYCKGWEYEGQTPWCYVFDNCSLASASGRPGSFGHRYLDCERDGGGGSVRRRRLQEQLGRLPMTAGDEAAARKAAARAAYAARAVASTISATPAEMPRSFPRRDPDEDALLERVERLKQPHVALVSLATEGFVTVELPPHRLSLRPHARTDALSLKGVFSFLPSGAILSLATNALFNLCAPLQSSDPESASSATDTRPQVCTSYDESGSAHPKLLRVSTPKTSRFKVEAQLREPRAKPSLKPSTSRGGKAKG